MGPAVVGGGGIIGLIVLVVALLQGGGGSPERGGPLGGLDSDLATECQTGQDANQHDDCRVVGVVNSVQAYWGGALPRYQEAQTVFFRGGTTTGCGSATSSVGPFYCPIDRHVYIDLGFYEDLRTRFGAQGGPFAEAYVIAHEYGHHVQNLRGVLERSQDGSTGPASGSVRVELMADCYAGVWAHNAVSTGYVEELTDLDIRDGLDAAAAVGDDRIQESARGRIDPESWTHGAAEQRQRWFTTGYRSGDVSACDTFAVAAP